MEQDGGAVVTGGLTECLCASVPLCLGASVVGLGAGPMVAWVGPARKRRQPYVVGRGDSLDDRADATTARWIALTEGFGSHRLQISEHAQPAESHSPEGGTSARRKRVNLYHACNPADNIRPPTTCDQL